jgi:broad specificity phosphatase PhoE
MLLAACEPQSSHQEIPQKATSVKIFVFMICMLACTSVFGDDTYSVYLIRHAEKDRSNPEDRNPKLNACGFERAQRLADIFQSIDLRDVYSSDYERTRDTASPTAVAKNLAVEIYDPANLNEILQRLRAIKQNALVVGHSNTTNVLAGLLAGVDLPSINDAEYDRLYQVVISNDDSTLQLLHQAFACS